MDGWIKLHRKIQSDSLYKSLNSKQRDIIIQLLLMASHSENEWEFMGKMYQIKSGQFITSLESIQGKCAKDVSIQNLRTCLLKLEKHGFLTNESTNKNRLITVVNWDIYQGEEEKLTSKSTDNQQATNKQLTTIKNVKNDKKEIYAEFVTMTEVEYTKLVDSHGIEFTKKCIEILDNYKGAKGEKYKSDYRAILNWVITRVKEDEEKSKGFRPTNKTQPEFKPVIVSDDERRFLQDVDAKAAERNRIPRAVNE